MQEKKKVDKNETEEDNKQNRRPFATGSKPGPDELDHYLEERGFYRKHVARDASSLFRVVSEQVFDIQNYHDKVRQDCASFMELNIKEYANEVDKNFYNYVSNLRRSRTYGTLLELRVVSRIYKRNVILFEPNQNMETIHRDFIKDEQYTGKEPIRVFYSHKDKHFDTIYPMETVERLAECQSIVYEILYTDVFKLPDVKYAVERMLHDQDEQSTLPLENDPGMYKNANGDIHKFDGHEDTNCVLKDPRTCHFHNQEDFDEVVNENKDAITIINRSDDPGKLKIFKPVDGFLYKSDKSCVRQLLDEKITPFPYKVAKALDPSIYRNTEFELWSENRKEQRMKWFDSNGLPLRETDERHWAYYGDYDKNRRFDSIKYSFHDSIINEDPLLGLDEDGKKKLIISNDDYKLGQLTNYDNFQPPRSVLEPIIMPVHVHHHRTNFRGNRRYNHNNNNNNRGYNNHNNNNMHHNTPNHHQHQNNNNMNYVGDIERENMHYNSEPEPLYVPPPNSQPPIFQEMPGNYQFVQYDQQSPPPMYQPSSQYQYIPTSPYQQPIPTVQYPSPIVPYTYSQPALISYPQPHAPAVQHNDARDSLNLIRENELNTQINWSAQESIDVTGSDLPLTDLATMQFYYNLGVRYFIASGISRRLENVVNQLDTLDINNNHNIDPPPVPVNTPVSTKPNSSGSGHRYQHNNNNNNNNMNNNNNRRVFHNSQSSSGNKDKGRIQHNYQRKEIQFNSNVKNVHKAEQNKSSNQVVSSQNSSVNSGSTQSSNNIERTSSALTPGSSLGIMTNLQLSPISPPSADVQIQNQEQQQVQPVVQMQNPQPPLQYIQQFPQQSMIPQQPLICYQTENGELMPLTPAVQPIYYGYPAAPQTPVFYQPQQTQILDGTVNSTDSGIVDFSAYAYQQAAYPIIYQPPTPIYYPQTPMISTQHVATTPQLAPVYPVAFNGTPMQSQNTAVLQDTILQQTNDSISTGLNETANTNSNNT